MDKVKGILAGAGYIASEHMKWYSMDPRVEISGIVDSNEEKGRFLAEKYSTEYFTSLSDAALKLSPDFCDVCLPSSLHASASKSAMQLGMDVICEKPMALTLSDIDAMTETEKLTGHRMMVAHVCRFMPQYYELKRIVDSLIIGRPITLTISRESETPSWSVNGWLWNRSMSGGTVMDLSIHDIDLSNWFFGTPDRYLCSVIGNPDVPGPSCVTSVMHYGCGVQSTVIANHLLPKGHPFSTSYRLTCTDGIAEFSSESDPSRIRLYTSEKTSDIDLTGMPGYDSGYRNELDQFISCLIDKKDFPVSNADARLAVASVLALSRSAESGS